MYQVIYWGAYLDCRQIYSVDLSLVYCRVAESPAEMGVV